VPTPTLPIFKVAGVTVNCADCCEEVEEVFVAELVAAPDPPQPTMETRLAMMARKMKTAACRVGATFMRKLSSPRKLQLPKLREPRLLISLLLQFAVLRRMRNRSLKYTLSATTDNAGWRHRTATFVSRRENGF
jgi:hypothetical protein